HSNSQGGTARGGSQTLLPRAECKVVRRTVGRATHPLHRLHTEWRRLPRIPPNRASRRLPTRCAACIPSRQTMKTLRVALVAALVAGCHFDKLFNSAPGGGHAPPAGSSSTRLAFTAPPTDAMKDSIIQPVQVTVFDSAGNVMTSFTGDVTLALGKDPSVPKARLSGRSLAAASAGVATFPDLSIDQIGDERIAVADLIDAQVWERRHAGRGGRQRPAGEARFGNTRVLAERQCDVARKARHDV